MVGRGLSHQCTDPATSGVLTPHSHPPSSPHQSGAGTSDNSAASIDSDSRPCSVGTKEPGTAQLVNCLLCEHEDLHLAPHYKHCVPVTPVLRKWKQKNHWGLMTIPVCQISEFQVRQEILPPQNKVESSWRRHLELCSSTKMYMHRHAHVCTHTHALTCMCSHTHVCTHMHAHVHTYAYIPYTWFDRGSFRRKV